MDVLSPSARQYTATGLKPESVYVFRLTAQTRKGWGEAAEALVVTTEKRGAYTVIHIIVMWLYYFTVIPWLSHKLDSQTCFCSDMENVLRKHAQAGFISTTISFH